VRWPSTQATHFTDSCQDHSQPCPLSSSYSRHSRGVPFTLRARNYHATRLLRQQDQAQLQEDGVAIQDDAVQSGESSTAITEPSTAEEIMASSSSAQEPELDGDGEADKLRENVRQLMRKVPSSVAVITVKSFDAQLGRHVPMGVAVSSLSTVTLNPPTISFNIKEPSQTLEAIRAADGRFRVYFPGADRRGAAMVDLFCHGNHHDAYKARATGLKIYVPGYGPGVEKSKGSPSHAPQIFDDAVRAAMECKLTYQFPVADHVILVAEIESMESKIRRDRTILYVDGTYMRPDGSDITVHGRPTAEAKHDTWTAWDYPLFPGEEERRDYVERIKKLILERPKKLVPGKESTRQIERSLSLSPGSWGINLEILVDECTKVPGATSQLPPHLRNLPVLCDLYGRLTPADRTELMQRAKDLVKEDPDFLSVNYKMFLQYLGVSTAVIDLLPGDIMEALRADGLVGPFQPRDVAHTVFAKDSNLQYLEQLQHRLVEHLAKMSHTDAVNSHLDLMMESLGESKTASNYFKKSWARLYAAASPEIYDSSKIDIAGDVSSEEALVVMHRVVRFLQPTNMAVFRRTVTIDPHEVLRLVGVHPSITGFNVEFFFGKIKHVYWSTTFSKDTPARIQSMLQPFFVRTISWTNFERRVQAFVQKMPLRAMSWSNSDKLAAMGINWECTLTVPVSDKKQSLKSGEILDTLIAKELKSVYGNKASSEALKQAVASYLKDQYNYDVSPISEQQLEAEAQTRSSGDDMEEAMRASRNMHGGRRTDAPLVRRELDSDGPHIHTHIGRDSSVQKGDSDALRDFEEKLLAGKGVRRVKAKGDGKPIDGKRMVFGLGQGIRPKHAVPEEGEKSGE
jgi:flavin reductase (DIM6/NTAB) family NADH-FMN oxidoreductase RutF